MAHRVRALLSLLGGLLLVGGLVTARSVGAWPGTTTPVACPVSVPQPPPPSVAGAAPAGTTWYAGNGLWVGVLGGWDARPDGLKVFWFREVPGALAVAGRRLDAAAPPLAAWIPSGYGAVGLQVSGLTFPSAGCWEIDGRAGAGEVRVVVAVAPAPAPDSGATPAAASPAADSGR